MWNANLRAKGDIRVNLFGIPRILTHGNNSYRNTLSRMNKNGLVKNTKGTWSITNEGKEYLKKKNLAFKSFKSPFKKNSSRNLLIMFDIPESRKKERVWFRQHLIKFNYFMLQKSVWIGPSPLPKEFVEYIRKIKLAEFIKSFRLTKSYSPDRKLI